MPYKDPQRQKEAQAEWYRNNKDTISKRHKINLAGLRAKAADWVCEYKASRPCVDCGQFDRPYLMDFDHLRDKKYGIARMVRNGSSIEAIQKEIEKCELVCCRCHRIRTFERAANSGNVA